MAPSSGELWGHHLMPMQVEIDCMLPTGVYVVLTCNRDETLEKVKAELWKEAQNYPMSHLLSDKSSYIFVSVSQDAETEEFYDETRRLCDLRLFMPMLKVVEPKGNKEEKMLNYDIGVAISMPVNDFNECKDLEVMAFRRNIAHLVNEVIETRSTDGQHVPDLWAQYQYPSNLHSQAQLPPHIQIKTQDKDLLVCIWVVSVNRNKQKYTVKVGLDSTPLEVIAEAIRYRTTKQNMSPEQQRKCIQEYKNSYVLKVCGINEYFFQEAPMTQYKYIRTCLSRDRIPQLMLMSREGVYQNIDYFAFTYPSYVKRGQSALASLQNRQVTLLWTIEDMFRIHVRSAIYVNARDTGKLYVRTGIFHGTEPLCQTRNTEQVEIGNPRWKDKLEFDVYVPDIPRSARLCLSLCSVSRKGKKVHVAQAWGNLNLFDFNDRLLSEKVSLHLWPMPPGHSEMLNPTGIPGSNPNPESPCLEIEIENYDQHRSGTVVFPDDIHIEKYINFIEQRNRDPSNFRHSTTAIPSANQLESPNDKELLNEILSRDVLAEISEQEKDLLWRMRNTCKNQPDSLSKLLNAVKWNSREDVAQLYYLLTDWPILSPEAALELLHCNNTDLRVRSFGVKCLEERLTDDELSQYLLQLVQVIKYEPYLDNALTRFLIKRSLENQMVGHFFFWYLKSEMHHPEIRMRFGLILEAHCRGLGPYLKTLCKQVEALEKLTKLTDALKEEKEDQQMKVLANQVKQADYVEALQQIMSPLVHSQKLGDLIVEECMIKKSKKKPLWLVWSNPDYMSDLFYKNFKILFKNGDDLRQDMLTLQIFRIMDSIWQSEGLDLRLIPYGCLATGLNLGMIEVVQSSKTVMKIQSSSLSGGIQLNTRELHKWIKEHNKDRYEAAIEAFTYSCAGYCVATFVLGIGDRHPDNIMVNEKGQVFHVDFGHFLAHRKKKLGINRERVPFVLTEDFIRVIAKDKDSPRQSQEFKKFQELCGQAYLTLRKHANLFITLFVMMLSCGIPELQSIDDIDYLRTTLGVDKTEQQALDYFVKRFNEAYNGSWTTKVDWFAHYLKHK